MTDIEIRDQPDQSRFVATVDGQDAVLEYTMDGPRMQIHHTGVPDELEGQGVGSRLARHALEAARDRGLTVWPDCPFVAAYIRRHPEYLELVDPAFPGRDGLGAG